MANRQARKINNAGIMAWKDQKRKLHFGVSDTGRLRSQESRLFNTGVPKLRNPEPQNPETGTTTGVSDTGRLRSQESRLFNTGNPKSRNAKSRNVKDSISEFRIPGVGGVKSQDSSSQESKVAKPEVTKCEIVKCQRLHFGVSDTGSWRSQESRLFITGVPKSQNLKSRKEITKCQRLHFGVSDTGSWRSQESRLFITGVPKSQNPKSRNAKS
jgi:hypothetical protein